MLLLPFQCDRRHMKTRLNSAGSRGPYRRSWSLSFLHLLSFLLHCFFPSQEPPDTFLERFSDDNKVIRTPEGISRDKNSSIMMKSSRLCTEPWWTPTFISNSLLCPSPTQTWLRALAYIPCTINYSKPSFLSANLITLRGTPSNAFFSRSTKAMLSLSLAGRYFSCSCLSTKIVSVLTLNGKKPNWKSSMDTNCLMRPSTILSKPALSRGSCSFPMHPLTLVEKDNEILLPVGGYLAIANDCSWEVPAARIISTTMPDGPGALPAVI